MEAGSVLLNMKGECHNLLRGDFPFMKSITQPLPPTILALKALHKNFVLQVCM